MPRGYGKFRQRQTEFGRTVAAMLREQEIAAARAARTASGARQPSSEDFVTTDLIDLNNTITFRDLRRTAHIASTPMGVTNPWRRMIEEHRHLIDRYGLDAVRVPEVDINFTQPPRTATEEAARLRWVRAEGRVV